MISFVLELKGDERIEGDCLWLCFSFIIITEVRRQMGSYNEKWMSEGNDGMVVIISLRFIFCPVS